MVRADNNSQKISKTIMSKTLLKLLSQIINYESPNLSYFCIMNLKMRFSTFYWKLLMKHELYKNIQFALKRAKTKGKI